MDLLIYSLLPFLGIMLGVVVVHEAGHYFTAKLFGVKVLEAGVGLPPRIAGFRWRDTDYTINALPLGAFVRMLGEEDPSDPQSLAAQPKWKRTIIIASGAGMNVILAIALFAAAQMIPHDVSAGGAQIGTVAPGSPAEQAGLMAGDQIYKVNGRVAESTSDAAYLIRLHQGSTIDLTIKRTDPFGRTGTEEMTVPVYARWNPQPYTDECGVERSQGPTGITIGAVSVASITRTPEELAKLEQDAKRAFAEYKKEISPDAPAWCRGGSDFGFVGLTAARCSTLPDDDRAAAEALKRDLFSESDRPCYEFEPGPAFEALTRTESKPIHEAVPDGTRLAFESLIFARNQVWSLIRGFDTGGAPSLTGPVGIAQATGEVVDEAGWMPLISLAATISMSLGILNILPIPMLDGGRLVFIFIEFIRRGRRIDPEKEALVHLTGLVAMLIMFAIVTYYDLARWIGGDSLLR